MISVHELQKVYGSQLVLDLPELQIAKGESFGLVGNNGAGKTTFFRLVLDLIEASHGYVEIEGTKVARSEAWKPIVGSFLDDGFLIDFLTPEEYFAFVGKLYGKTAGDMEVFLNSMSEMFNGEILGTKKLIRDFSQGNRKKIGITAALIGSPKILILDEPFTALDPSTQIRLKRFLNDLQEQSDITMLISSHDLNHITEVCRRIVVLEHGRAVRDIATGDDTLKELESYFAV